MKTHQRGRSMWAGSITAGLCLLGSIAQAATQWWDTSAASGLTAGNGNWSTGVNDTNWASSAAPGTAAPGPWTNGNDAVFSIAGASTATVSSVIANTLTFSVSGPVMVGSGPLTLSNGMSTTFSLNQFVPIVLAGDQTWVVGGSRVMSNLAAITEIGGARALTLDNITGTQAGTLVTTNNNSFSGGLTVMNGIFSCLGGGTGAGLGPVTLGTAPLAGQRGTATLSLDTVAAGNTTATLGNLTAAGMGALTIKTTAANSTNIVNAQVLSRQGRGVVEIIPANSLAVKEQLTFTGVPGITNGMLPAWIMDNKANTFVTYSGGLTDVTYDTGAWNNTKKFNPGTTTLTANASAYALKLGGAMTLNPGVTLSLGNGSGQAGLCMNNQALSGGTVDFGAAEGVIYINGNNPVIATALSGSGGLTIFGGGGGLNYNLMVSNSQSVLDVGPIVAYDNGSTSTGLKFDTSPCDKTIASTYYSYSAGLFKYGPNTLTLAGATNVVGGNLIVYAGGVNFQGRVANVDGTLTVQSGGTLNFHTNISTMSSAVAVNGGGSMYLVNSTNTFLSTVGAGPGNVPVFIVSNATVTSSGNVYMASGATNGAPVITGGSVWNMGGQTLYGSFQTGTGNMARIENGSIITNAASVSVSGNAPNNTLVISNNCKIYSTGSPTLCSGTNSTMVLSSNSTWSAAGGTVTFAGGNMTNNLLRVESGAEMNAIYRFYTAFGAGADLNTMIVTNGGRIRVTGSGFYVTGNAGKNNTVVVTGDGSFVDLGTTAIYVGNQVGSSGNVLRVERGGMVTNASIGGIGVSSFDNGIIVTNGGRYYGTAANGVTVVNNAGNNNYLVVDGTNSWLNNNGQLLTITAVAATNNRVVIQNGGVVTNVSTVTVASGAGATGNYLTVTSGGRLYSTANSTVFNHAAAAGNSVLVTGAGSLWDAGNSLLTMTLGTNNTLRVEQGAQLTASGLSVGNQNGNTFSNAGGVLEFTTVTPTITLGSAAVPGVSVVGGTVSFRNVAAANVKGNWLGTQLTNVTFSGTNAFRLNNSTNLAVTTTNQTYRFDAVATAPTNYAGLEMVNGNTTYTNGSVTVGTNGWLTFSNTTAVMWDAVTNYGTIRIFNSSVTFKTNLWMASGSRMTWVTNSLGNPVTVLGSLRVSSNTWLDASGMVNAGGTLTLFSASNGISGSPDNWRVLPNSHRVSIVGSSLVLTPRLPGFLFYVE